MAPYRPSLTMSAALREQYRDHPSWSAQLHHDNLQVRVDADPSLGPMPSYETLTRVMRSGAGAPAPTRAARARANRARGARGAELRGLAQSRAVTRRYASWQAPGADRGRPMTHAHPAWLPRRPLPARLPLPVVPRRDRRGLRPRLCQAFMKRGLPRALMTDNGAAMTAGEVEEGLHRLGICCIPRSFVTDFSVYS